MIVVDRHNGEEHEVLQYARCAERYALPAVADDEHIKRLAGTNGQAQLMI